MVAHKRRHVSSMPLVVSRLVLSYSSHEDNLNLQVSQQSDSPGLSSRLSRAFFSGPSRAPGSPDGPRQSRDGEWLDGGMVQSLKWPPISPTLATRGPHGHAGIRIRPSGNHPGFWRNNGFCCFCLDWCEAAMGLVRLFWFQVVTSRQVAVGCDGVSRVPGCLGKFRAGGGAWELFPRFGASGVRLRHW
jgi:hypothetical protein